MIHTRTSVNNHLQIQSIHSYTTVEKSECSRSGAVTYKSSPSAQTSRSRSWWEAEVGCSQSAAAAAYIPHRGRLCVCVCVLWVLWVELASPNWEQAVESPISAPTTAGGGSDGWKGRGVSNLLLSNVTQFNNETKRLWWPGRDKHRDSLWKYSCWMDWTLALFWTPVLSHHHIQSKRIVLKEDTWQQLSPLNATLARRLANVWI